MFGRCVSALLALITAHFLTACQAQRVLTPLPGTPTARASATLALPSPTATVLASPTAPLAVSTLPVFSTASAPEATTSVPSHAVALTLLAKWGVGPVNDLTWAPDSVSLAVASSDGVYLYNARTMEERGHLLTARPIQRVAFSLVNNLLAAASPSDGAVQVWDVHSRRRLVEFAVGDPGGTG